MRNILKNLVIPLVILALAVAVAMAMVKSRGQLPKRERVADVPAVEAIAVRPGPVPVTLRSRGVVRPFREIDLVSEVSGRVIWVDPGFLLGEQVAAGQLLLRIDPIDYEVALSDARAALASAELSLAEVKVVVAKAAIAEAEARVAAARDRLRQAEVNLANTEIRAPFDAVVDIKQVDLGQYVQTGMSLMSLLSTDLAEVRLPLLASDLPFVRYGRDGEGQWYETELRATFGAVTHGWQARLARLERRVDAETRVFFLVAQVERPYDLSLHSHMLAMGLFVEATFKGSPIPDAVRLPRSALHKGEFVYLVEEGRLVRRAVTLLRSEGDSVIVSGGLDDGDRVVLTRLDLMVDGMAVNADG